MILERGKKLLGNFSTLEEASSAYTETKKNLHPEAFSAAGQ